MGCSERASTADARASTVAGGAPRVERTSRTSRCPTVRVPVLSIAMARTPLIASR